MSVEISSSVVWNDRLRMAVSDVDETIADVYTPAETPMINELSRLLADGVRLFLVTGGGLSHVVRRITNHIDADLRRNILVSHCSGAEVWGFEQNGELRTQPFYSVYEEQFSPDLKNLWRNKTRQLLNEFSLRTHEVRPVSKFFAEVGRDPLDIMYDDRGPQITLELVNAWDLSAKQVAAVGIDVPVTHGHRDLRIPVLRRAEQILADANIPVTPRLGGTFAIDLAVAGVSKTTSIQWVLSNPEILATIGLSSTDLSEPHCFEIWGDKFSAVRGGTDRHMSEALPPQVRAIDFRDENPTEFLPGYNTVLWTGTQKLHHGLLEYLQSRR